MEDNTRPTEHRKRRRRRRRQEKVPISAKLYLDGRGKGDTGVLSDDIFDDLFGAGILQDQSNEIEALVRHVAVAHWSPITPSSIEDNQWTILPVRRQPDMGGDITLPPCSIQIPVVAPALQSLIPRLADTIPSLKGRPLFEVLIIDVKPLILDEVFIRLNGDALKKHHEVQKKFGGGFLTARANAHPMKSNGKGKVSDLQTSSQVAEPMDISQDKKLFEAIRKGLGGLSVLHEDTLVPLPLAAHPITHVHFPPLRIMKCEPVGQGVISNETRIIIDVDGHSGRQASYVAKLVHDVHRPVTGADFDDDTSNEHFFSAIEDGDWSDTQTDNHFIRDDSPSSTSESAETSDESDSDDALDGMISLSNSDMSSSQIKNGFMSSMTAGTPRLLNSRKEGTATPGSVLSNFTSRTARQGSGIGKIVFHAKAFTKRISDELLHPRPTSEDDEEVRVVVDIKVLKKLGCFSGDWVRIRSIFVGSSSGVGSWEMDTLEEDEEVELNWRAAKIYGISDIPIEKTTRYPKATHQDRRSSFTASQNQKSTLIVYMSPLLLANLGQPNRVEISTFPSFTREGPRSANISLPSSAYPPTAKEVTLLRVPTPLSTERGVQAAIIAGLKQYFEHKRRIVYSDDYLAIAIDSGASRTLSQSSANGEAEQETYDILSSGSMAHDSQVTARGVVWFKIGQVVSSTADKGQHAQEHDVWSKTLCIEPVVTRMVQAGSEQCSIPSTRSNPWEHYMGLRCIPSSISMSNTVQDAMTSIPSRRISQIQSRLQGMLAAATSSRASFLKLKPIVILLHSTQRNIGKAFITRQASSDLGLHVFEIDAYDVLGEGGQGGGDIKTEATLKARMERALSCGAEHTVPLIRHVDAWIADRMITALKEMVQSVRVLVATTTDLDKVSESARSLFTHEFEISAPDEGERKGILGSILQDRGIRLAYDVDLGSIAIKTAALVAGDLEDVVDRAFVARQERLEKLAGICRTSRDNSPRFLLRDILVSGGTSVSCVTKADFEFAVDAARKNFADAIGAPKIPNVSWDDVGGLTNVKDAVMETIQLPLERPELFAKGMKKRSGILFYGPPGTGKTLLAKAIATEFSLNFFSVKGPELLNMYIGESEANVRRVFQRARDARPCVVFFDELDSVAPKRGNQGDSGGVMDRIVSQLLAELDGMSNGDAGAGGVFVIGATNRPDLLDQALLRPGRFDKMLYLGVSDTHGKQLTILEALTRKFSLYPDMSLRRVAESLPFTYTGADLYALCSDAMLKAISRQASAVDSKIKELPGGPVSTAYFFDHYATKEDIAVVVMEEDFFAAQKELVGSVSAKELEHYQTVRRTFEGPEREPHVSNKSSAPIIRKTNAPVDDHTVPSRPKFKSRVSSHNKGKGKAKAALRVPDDKSSSSDIDEAYVTSNDYGTPPRRPQVNGVSARNSKGKEPLRNHERIQESSQFGDAAENDDKELYG